MIFWTTTCWYISDVQVKPPIRFQLMHTRTAWSASFVWFPLLAIALFSAVPDAGAQALAATVADTTDPRIGLRPGWADAGQAARNLELIAHRPRPERFFDPASMSEFGLSNTDLAFSGNHVFVGSYNGFQVWDISDAKNPRLQSSFVCPGGQGDVSVLRNLLFVSVEETRGRLDCGGEGVEDTVSTERFRGVRIFDISNIDQPRQVAAVQTCRGSHTHTLVTDPKDNANVYVYVSGTAPVRPAAELAGCSGRSPEEDPNTSLFRIEVIRVPLAAPQEARVISTPRIFADPTTGNIAGLWRGGEHGPGTQRTAETNRCHDITVYADVGLAAGACSGNGILLDIRDVANPVRIDEVSDPNFAFWHSATFNNAGTKVLFTDEWGGGTAPRCRATDRPEWGANAIFTLKNRDLQQASYYKLPAPQAAQENCVAHNGSLIPVPGRDIMVQAWYQGGVSVFDFTDPTKPVEIAYFDRGPMSATELVTGGYWSAYWYNGHIYGSEIGRGLDVFQLKPSEHLSRDEIEAANLVRFEHFNPQDQQKLVWPARFVVARVYLDQLVRYDGLQPARAAEVAAVLRGAERLPDGPRRRAAFEPLAARLESLSRGTVAGKPAGYPDRLRLLAETVRAMANPRQ